MHSFTISSPNKALFCVDKDLYSLSVLTKVLYQLSNNFTISTISNVDNYQIEIYSTNQVDWQETEHIISQLLIDYKLREIIEAETHDIRNILYIKAFANLDDFKEYE